MRNCHTFTLVRPAWRKEQVNSYIYMEVALSYKSIRVDERDMSRTF